MLGGASGDRRLPELEIYFGQGLMTYLTWELQEDELEGDRIFKRLLELAAQDDNFSGGSGIAMGCARTRSMLRTYVVKAETDVANSRLAAHHCINFNISQLISNSSSGSEMEGLSALLWR